MSAFSTNSDAARSARHNAFATYHPAVIFCYFVAVIVYAMSTLQPVFVAISFLSGSLYAVYLRGFRAYLGMLKFCFPIFLIIAIANPLFSGTGLTVLFYLGSRPITWEALAYGMCAGGMLSSVIIWFACYQEVMTSDKFLCLFARIMPVVSLVVSMIFRFVPSLVTRARMVSDSILALHGSRKPTLRERRDQGVLLASILMGWSMESSIETADSMRARGFGTTRRSTYLRTRLDARDVASLVVLVLLSALCALLVYTATEQFLFYPVMPRLKVFWWGYGIYVLLLLFPFLLEGRERLQWRRFRS